MSEKSLSTNYHTNISSHQYHIINAKNNMMLNILYLMNNEYPRHTQTNDKDFGNDVSVWSASLVISPVLQRVSSGHRANLGFELGEKSSNLYSV